MIEVGRFTLADAAEERSGVGPGAVGEKRRERTAHNLIPRGAEQRQPRLVHRRDDAVRADDAGDRWLELEDRPQAVLALTVRTEERPHSVARAQLADCRQQLQQVVGRRYHAVADGDASGPDGEVFAARTGQQQNRRVEGGGLQVTEHRRHVDPVLRRIEHEQIGRARLQRGHHAGDIARSDPYVRGTAPASPVRAPVRFGASVP